MCHWAYVTFRKRGKRVVTATMHTGVYVTFPETWETTRSGVRVHRSVRNVPKTQETRSNGVLSHQGVYVTFPKTWETPSDGVHAHRAPVRPGKLQIERSLSLRL